MQRLGSLLEVGTGFHPELTGRENVYLNGAILGMRRRQIASRFNEIVEFAGVERFIDTPIKRYSSGMYLRLAFAVAAHLEAEIMAVDEVLAVGDAEFQRRCLAKMSSLETEGRTVVFVSHDLQWSSVPAAQRCGSKAKPSRRTARPAPSLRRTLPPAARRSQSGRSQTIAAARLLSVPSACWRHRALR